MTKSTDQLLSVEEVLELVPGDEQNATWVNPGFKAVVRTIKRTQSKAGKTMNICTLGSETGSAEISMTVWQAIKFKEGDVIEVSGQGLRRTEYNGLAQVTISQKTEIHVLGKSVHAAEQQERAANSAPAVNGDAPAFNGQSVGMAMKESLALTVMAWGGVDGLQKLKDPLFWADVKTNASNILRISRSLEHGKLSPSPWQSAEPKAERAAPPPQQQQPPARRGSPQTERQAQNLSDSVPDEDIPF